jgi:hypothetical protein
MNWRRSGRRFLETCLEDLKKELRKANPFGNDVEKEVAKRLALSPEYQFVCMARDAAQGHPSKLAEYLESKPDLSDYQWTVLAKFVRGEFKQLPKKRGQPKNKKIRDAADWADYFYQMWRRENLRQGINDYGRRADMKEMVIEFVIEFKRLSAEDFIKIRDLMDRPKARRI